MWKRFWMWLTKPTGCDSRGLFLFHDSIRWRTIDGMTALREFYQLPQNEFDWDSASNGLREPFSTVQVATSKRIAEAIRKVFQVKPDTLTETECLALLSDFRLWTGDVKKNTSLYPISLDSTESESLDPLEIPPHPSLGSGSTPKEKSSDDAGLPAVPTLTTTIP